MVTYNIYGIGAALVDTEVEVSDAFLASAHINKSVEAKAIDTNGAGDMFAGAFLYAIILGKSYAWAASLANGCAARVVAQFRPRLEASEFDVIKARFGL